MAELTQHGYSVSRTEDEGSHTLLRRTAKRVSRKIQRGIDRRRIAQGITDLRDESADSWTDRAAERDSRLLMEAWQEHKCRVVK